MDAATLPSEAPLPLRPGELRPLAFLASFGRALDAALTPRPVARPPHLPSLDGLRAVSIALVLFNHLHLAPPWVPAAWLNLGELGVRAFFVISGFLITTLLIEETLATGSISLPRFYLRRAFRIFPAFYVLVLATLVLQAAGVITLAPGDLRSALTYTMNYHHDRAWYLGHGWSLSVEEQFYLLWAALLLLLGLRRGLWVAAAAVVLAPLARVLTFYLWPGQRDGIGESFQTVFDALATGCLLAGAQHWLGQRPHYLRWLRSPWFLAVVLVPFVCNAAKGYIAFDYPLGETLMNVSLALCLDRWVRFPHDRVGRALNSRPLVWVGRMSYSLYLWQQLFMGRDGFLVQRPPLNLLCALLAAALSYSLVEQPCVRWYRKRAAGAAAVARLRPASPA